MDWQPIETAPKDGVRFASREIGPEILLVDEAGVRSIGFWNGRSWDDGDYFSDMGVMTHWMPLPKPPK